jgi:acyl-CoA synthetase (NDP forming)
MLESLFNPGAVAVIARPRTQKVGHAVLNNLVRFNFKGALSSILCSEILGLKAYANVSGHWKAR